MRHQMRARRVRETLSMACNVSRNAWRVNDRRSLAAGRAKEGANIRGHGDGFPRGGDGHQRCRGRGEALPARHSRNIVCERHRSGFDIGDGRFDPYQVVVSRRRVKPQRRFRHGELHTTCFHRGVRHAALADKVRATDLAPDEIVRVIRDPHLVGFGVSHADFADRRCHSGWVPGVSRLVKITFR